MDGTVSFPRAGVDVSYFLASPLAPAMGTPRLSPPVTVSRSPGVQQGLSKALLWDLTPQQKQCPLQVLCADRGPNTISSGSFPGSRGSCGGARAAQASTPRIWQHSAEGSRAVQATPLLLSGYRLESSKMQKMHWESRLA